MKPIKIKKRLVLKKETVAHLEKNELRLALGGGNTKPPTFCDCPTIGCPTKGIPVCTT